MQRSSDEGLAHADRLGGAELMPEETQAAVDWAVSQLDEGYDHGDLVDKVREYFNENDIEYSTFSYADLAPYLPQ